MLTRIGRRSQYLFCFIFNLGQTFSFWKIKKSYLFPFLLHNYPETGLVQDLNPGIFMERIWNPAKQRRDWKQLIQRVVDNIDHVPTAQFTRNFLDKYERKDLAETPILIFMQNETFCELPVCNGVHLQCTHIHIWMEFFLQSPSF